MQRTKLLLPLALSLLSIPAFTQVQVKSTENVNGLLSAKLFPLISEIHDEASVHQLILGNKTFQKIRKAQLVRTKRALENCSSVICYAEALKITKPEVRQIGDELIEIFPKEPSLNKLVATLRKQGYYTVSSDMADTSLLRNSLNKTFQGINQVIDVYIKGIKPRYAKIDSISFRKEDAIYKRQLHDSLSMWIKKGNRESFYSLPLKAALMALKSNGRDEAARFVPLHTGLNAASFEKIKHTDFSAYAYSVILIPGLGPEEDGVALDPKGAARCREGVERYKKGLAPFIIVSGGNVHPFKTPYNEAVEMKKYIVSELGVPEHVVMIEPDARHTTTNLRNTSRMIYHFNMPVEKPVLIVTDESQSTYIVNRMTATAKRDLGYVPYRDLKKLSSVETSFYPSWTSLQVDPLDPLDP